MLQWQCKAALGRYGTGGDGTGQDASLGTRREPISGASARAAKHPTTQHKLIVAPCRCACLVAAPPLHAPVINRFQGCPLRSRPLVHTKKTISVMTAIRLLDAGHVFVDSQWNGRSSLSSSTSSATSEKNAFRWSTSSASAPRWQQSAYPHRQIKWKRRLAMAAGFLLLCLMMRHTFRRSSPAPLAFASTVHEPTLSRQCIRTTDQALIKQYVLLASAIICA
jgi:hypothetical protein